MKPASGEFERAPGRHFLRKALHGVIKKLNDCPTRVLDDPQ